MRIIRLRSRYTWAVGLLLSASAVAQVRDYPYTPVKFSDVKIHDGFWSPRIETNRTVTIPFAFNKCKTTGRLDNFKVAGQVNRHEITTGKFCSLYGYDDSDVYKIIEGASYSLTTCPDPALEAFLDSLIADIAAAQEPDGYLYTMRTINPEKSWAKQRWIYDRYNSSHEIYNVGHMYEAAVAYYYATGKRTLLDVALKNADLLCNTFGPGKQSVASGHQEVEIGLAKLYRVTGDEKYLDLAKFLLDQRGKGEKAGSTYTQDHLPVTEQKEAVGHAVRATYMYSAMADIAALKGDTAYLRAIDGLWADVVAGKTYLTGGIGARANGEAYGDAFELPNLTAYNETCAAIANIFWNYRMFLLHGDSKYIDVLERVLYNGMISGVSLDGTTFFYPNPLASEGNYSRSEWFDCSCCPSNVTRFISSVSGYLYATRGDSLFVNLFAGSTGKVLLGGKECGIVQETNYPWDGVVSFTINADKPVTGALCIRIPGWVRNEVLPGGPYSFMDTVKAMPSLEVNGKLYPLKIKKGYAVIDKTWKSGDRVILSLPMPVRKVAADPRIADDRDRIALERGPIVFCAEGIDNGGQVGGIIFPRNAAFTWHFDSTLLKGVGVVDGEALHQEGDGFSAPVRDVSMPFRAIPYYAWCHRGAGTMNVWFYGPGFVFPPEMKPSTSLFTDTLSVKLKQYEGQTVAYTLYGTTPSPGAQMYHLPLLLDHTATLHAAAYNEAGKESEVITGTFSKVEPEPASSLVNPQPGLLYSYYEGRYRKLPDFSGEKILKEGVVPALDVVTPRDTADAYALVFTGWLNVPAGGVYTFDLVSDDGARLVINGREVVINDGLHEMESKTGQAALEAGYHKVRVEFFDYGAAEGLELYISGPGLQRTLLPAGMLFH